MSSPEPLAESADQGLRLFTAIALPPALKERVADLLSRLQKGAAFTGAHPTWVAAENIHITLVFLGSQPVERLQAVREAADMTARQAQAFELKLGGLHLFPTPKEPKVLSLGMSGALEPLTRVRESLAAELRQRGFEVESRPFRPHLTLARIKSMRGVTGLRSLVDGHQKLNPGALQADRITVYKSTLRSTGPEYEVLHEAVFGRNSIPE